MNKEPQKKLVVGVTVGVSALTLLRGQLEWFSSNGWQVTLVSSPDLQSMEAAKREGVQFIGLPMQREISLLKDLQSLWKWILLLRSVKPHAINVGTPKAALIGSLAGFIMRVPRRLYVVRGLRLEGTTGLLSLILWLMEWITMSLATDVFFVSASLAEEAKSRKLLRESKSWLIGSGSSNGVDAPAISDRVSTCNALSLKTELGFVNREFVVGFIGRISRDKGIQTIVDALSDPLLDKNVKALFIGQVEDSDIENQIDALGDRIVVIPWTDDVWGYLPALSVLCLPTRREGFPNVVLECAAASIPTITSRATGAVDSVIDGETGLLIEIDDSAALVKYLNKLNRDPEFTQKLGRAARKRVVTEFSPKRIWTGVNEILSGVHSPLEAQKFKA